ncbi:MAG: copper amine oxidase N-terminal domain-containing protein [Clostridiales bacterium]|nr:copper amine oxidase N-terminal domain-containing protein [Clostridiales bacterium]
MKRLIGIIAAVCMMCSFSQAAFAAAQSIVINGVVQEIPEDMGEIIEQDDRTFVPLRFVSEKMNKTVKYDENLKGAYVMDKSDLYIIQEGKTFISKIENFGNTTITQMDVAAFTKQYDIGGRMYIPIRFMAEAFGYVVGWDEETQTVTIDDVAAGN